MDTTTPSKVYLWPLTASGKAPYAQRIRRLFKATHFLSQLNSGDLVALKLHFGEQGGTAFVQPQWLIPIIDLLRKSGTRPFLTDTNTLYAGQRVEAVSHAFLAAQHGFDPLRLGAPVHIADGLKSHNQISIPSSGPHFEHCYLAGDIMDADAMVTISHFTGHELTGFGGALKNLAMGCASKQGKMHQHCGLGPKVQTKHCTGCGHCLEVCAPGALALDESGFITLDREACTGCANCLLACRDGCLHIDWSLDVHLFMERMIEYADTIQKSFAQPILHMSFMLQVTPECDCKPYSDSPLCPDIGVVAAFDPVALDQACVDLINAAPGLESPSRPLPPTGQDKFKSLHPRVDGLQALKIAQKRGIGTRSYQLVTIT